MTESPRRLAPPLAVSGLATRPNGAPSAGAVDGPGWRSLLSVFGATLVVYVVATSVMLRYIEPPTGDQPHYLLGSISLIEDGDLDLRNNYTTDESYGQFSSPGRRRDGFRGIRVSYRLEPEGHVVVRPSDGGDIWYPKHGVGLPVLLLPGWVFGSAFAPLFQPLTADGGGGWPGAVLEMNVLGALLATQIFMLAWDVTRNRGAAFAVWVVTSFSVPNLLLSMMIFPETPAALLLIFAFRHLMRGTLPRPIWRVLLVSLAIAVLTWLNPRSALLAGCLALSTLR